MCIGKEDASMPKPLDVCHVSAWSLPACRVVTLASNVFGACGLGEGCDIGACGCWSLALGSCTCKCVCVFACVGMSASVSVSVFLNYSKSMIHDWHWGTRERQQCETSSMSAINVRKASAARFVPP